VKKPETSTEAVGVTDVPVGPTEIGGLDNDTMSSTGLPEEIFFSENGTLLLNDYKKSKWIAYIGNSAMLDISRYKIVTFIFY